VTDVIYNSCDQSFAFLNTVGYCVKVIA